MTKKKMTLSLTKLSRLLDKAENQTLGKWLQKCRISPAHEELFSLAHSAWKESEPEMTFSDWVRLALVEQAKADLEE